MRPFLFIILLILTSFRVSAQSDSIRHHMRPKIGPVTITGIVLVSAGPVVSTVGLLTLIHENQKVYTDRPQQHNGEIILGTGLTMVAAGITMCIIGGIHDHKKARKASWSITAPKGNEIGIAYNF